MEVDLVYRMTQDQNSEITRKIDQERNKLFGFIRKRVNTDEDAQDILQDVFFQFIQMYRNLETIEQTSSWLYRVARNRITDSYRKKREDSVEDRFGMGSDDLYIEELLPLIHSQTPEDDFTNDLIWEVLEEGLEELPEEQSLVFVRHELEGRSFKEISEETGLTVNTLISRKRYAVLHLREKLTELFNELNTI